MTAHLKQDRRSSQRGSTLIEFAFTAVLVCVLLFASIEFDRMVLVYTTLANSARVGARYAIVHGASRTGTGATGPSGPSDNPTEVVGVIRNYAAAGLLDTAALNISVKYPAGNSPGSTVNVTVTYRYDPFTGLPLGVTLGSNTSGVIAF